MCRHKYYLFIYCVHPWCLHTSTILETVDFMGYKSHERRISQSFSCTKEIYKGFMSPFFFLLLLEQRWAWRGMWTMTVLIFDVWLPQFSWFFLRVVAVVNNNNKKKSIPFRKRMKTRRRRNKNVTSCDALTRLKSNYQREWESSVACLYRLHIC